MDDNLYSDFLDEIANYEFQQAFYSKFENSELTFLSGSLQHCLKQVTIEKKPLVFFLHNENDEYSQNCCKLLNEKDVEDFINENFLIMGWKINNENKTYAEDLANTILIIENVREYVKKGTSCIFIIIPNMDSVKIDKELKITKENTDETDFLLSDLKDVQKLMSLYIKQENFENMTSIKYQQWMYEELGDRSYDGFEKNEHDKLKDKLWYATYGPPKQITGYDDKQKKEIDPIYEKIRSKNNQYSKWNDRIVIAFIYNCLEPTAKEKSKKTKSNEDYKAEQDFYPVPVFVLRKCKKSKENGMKQCPCRIFIDGSGRVYDSWKNYLANNVLPPRKMIYPVDGKYQVHPTNFNEVWLDEQYTPSSSKRSEILKAADIGSGITGFLSGAAMVATMFTPLAAVTVPYAIVAGVTTGIYAAGRGTGTIVDRKIHDQSINITDSESRGAYLNIAAGTAGLAGAGATTLLTKFAQEGANIGKGALYTVNFINGTNIAIAGTATVNGFYDVYQQWSEDRRSLSSLTVLQLGTSLFFFGNSVVNFRLAGTIVQEVQTSTLNEINQALRSNRHRKSFNKLLKETTRVSGDTKGKAEVIATMRNPATRDDILAVLTRSNKNFNKNGIRFSAEGGGIALNGVSVDILEFGNIPKSQHSMYFEAFPPIQEAPVRLNNTRTIVENMQLHDNIRGFFSLTDSQTNMSSIGNSLASFKEGMQQKIIAICANFMNLIDINCIKELKGLLSGDVKTNIIIYVANFIKKSAIDIKNIFESRLLNEDVKKVCRDFGFADPHVLINDFVDYVVDKFTSSNEMMETLLCNFQTWMNSLVYDEEMQLERKTKRHEGPKKKKKDCPICGGYYYEIETK